MVKSIPVPTRRELSAYFAWFLIWVAVTVVAAVLTPHPDGHGTHRQLGFPPCPSVLLLNRPCPGCGLTTSWTATVHGQLSQAIAAHPLGPILYIGFTVSALLALGAWVRRRAFVYTVGFHRLSWVLIAAYFAFSTYRFLYPPESYRHNPFAPPSIATARSVVNDASSPLNPLRIR